MTYDAHGSTAAAPARGISAMTDCRTVLITGASSGIVLATAKLLAEHSARVVLVSRSKEKLEKLSKELPLSIAIDADITKIHEN